MMSSEIYDVIEIFILNLATTTTLINADEEFFIYRKNSARITNVNGIARYIDKVGDHSQFASRLACLLWPRPPGSTRPGRRARKEIMAGCY